MIAQNINVKMKWQEINIGRKQEIENVGSVKEENLEHVIRICEPIKNDMLIEEFLNKNGSSEEIKEGRTRRKKEWKKEKNRDRKKKIIGLEKKEIIEYQRMTGYL